MPRRALISLILKVSGNVNADMGVGTRIPLKKIVTWDQKIKPFVSARNIRRCIREKLYERFQRGEKEFNIDPLQLIGPEGKEQLGDIGDPVEYVDDDLFGFLRPEEVPVRRIGPVRISHLISLRHAEVRVEFAGRFARDFLPEYEEQFPVPFEIELAEWLGKLDVIVSDRVGRFAKSELTEDVKKKLGGELSLSLDMRKKRLSGFLEVLLWEGWEFPRGAQSPSVPDYHYAIVALTERFIPIFGFVDITEEGELNMQRIDDVRSIYGSLIDELIVLNYKKPNYSIYRQERKELRLSREGRLEEAVIREIIKDVCDYVVR
ncbi:MAG: type I-B CRISPR-associated protein Cas7/Cst2/DevR [Candidatus Hadarchaeales archaeon]